MQIDFDSEKGVLTIRSNQREGLRAREIKLLAEFFRMIPQHYTAERVVLDERGIAFEIIR